MSIEEIEVMIANIKAEVQAINTLVDAMLEWMASELEKEDAKELL